MNQQFDILFLVATGIGNAIEILYAVEHCIRAGKKTGLFLLNTSPSFVDYLRDSYGEDVILSSLDGLHATNVVHSWLFQGEIPVSFNNYFYINPNSQNTVYQSETEQYLSVAKSLYPSSFEIKTLSLLKQNYSDRIKKLGIERKYIIYPGCNSNTPVKRWPYFPQLIRLIGGDNIFVLGSNDDLVYEHSHYYPAWLTGICPHYFLRKRSFFNLFKKLGLLKKHAHLDSLKDQCYSYFDSFTWPELSALFSRAKYFIGNDGGLTHLAAACGASGIVIFGPTSVRKNRPYNELMKPISKLFDCQPCQFMVNMKDKMSYQSILCPHQVRCLYSITAEDIVAKINV